MSLEYSTGGLQSHGNKSLVANALWICNDHLGPVSSNGASQTDSPGHCFDAQHCGPSFRYLWTT